MKSIEASSFGIFFSTCDVGVMLGAFTGHHCNLKKEGDKPHDSCKKTFEGTKPDNGYSFSKPVESSVNSESKDKQTTGLIINPHFLSLAHRWIEG